MAQIKSIHPTIHWEDIIPGVDDDVFLLSSSVGRRKSLFLCNLKFPEGRILTV